jgi:RNA polymerase sigma factor (TIGR02999 family)
MFRRRSQRQCEWNGAEGKRERRLEWRANEGAWRVRVGESGHLPRFGFYEAFDGVTCPGAVNEITQALRAMQHGESGAAERLLELVYAELQRMAATKMALERSGGTLQRTALVHEAWLRLGGPNQPAWENRAHFFGAAAEAMRRILIGRARRRQAQRRGGGQIPVDLDRLDVAAPEADEQTLAVNEALEKFAEVDPQKAELVKLRFFIGLTIEEAAKTLRISDATAKRWWAFARAWLHRQMAM